MNVAIVGAGKLGFKVAEALLGGRDDNQCGCEGYFCAQKH